MKKGSGTKTRISLTIDKDLAEELNNICEERFMKISPFVEHLIKKGLEEVKKKQ
ncbi:hypothetical protein GF336_01920 [Candidatus Woesearchaeota archaeon]|nr:hypothetical protein [Candidatus Woesearchaeota archaeon]